LKQGWTDLIKKNKKTLATLEKKGKWEQMNEGKCLIWKKGKCFITKKIIKKSTEFKKKKKGYIVKKDS